MKPTSQFRLDTSTKSMLMMMKDPHERTKVKKAMIKAQLAADAYKIQRMRSKEKDKE